MNIITSLVFGMIACINPDPNIRKAPHQVMPRIIRIDVETYSVGVNKIALAEKKINRPLAFFQVHEERKFCDFKPNGISEVCYVQGRFQHNPTVVARIEFFDTYPSIGEVILPEIDMQISTTNFRLTDQKGLILLHELLHTYYLGHNDETNNVMSSRVGLLEPYILKDHIQFLQCLILDMYPEGIGE